MSSTELEKLKTKGNHAYSSEDWQTAIKFYSEAIKISGKDAVFYSNRAACHIKLKEWRKGLEDCEKGLGYLDGAKPAVCMKLYWRKGICQKELGDVAGAKATFKMGLTKYPDSVAMKAELDLFPDWQSLKKSRDLKSKMPVPAGSSKSSSASSSLTSSSSSTSKQVLDELPRKIFPIHIVDHLPAKFTEAVQAVDSGKKSSMNEKKALIDTDKRSPVNIKPVELVVPNKRLVEDAVNIKEIDKKSPANINTAPVVFNKKLVEDGASTSDKPSASESKDKVHNTAAIATQSKITAASTTPSIESTLLSSSTILPPLLTLYSLMKLMRSSKSELPQVYLYLFNDVRPETYIAIHQGGGIDYEVIEFILDAIIFSEKHSGDKWGSKALAILDAIAMCPRFSVSKMFISTSKLNELQNKLKTAQVNEKDLLHIKQVWG